MNPDHQGKSRPAVTISACCAMTFVLGTIHAFSVFVTDWETLPGASRANVSFIYSLALASLTIAVLFGHRVFNRYRPATLFAGAGLLAALGLGISATSHTLSQLYIFYGVVFGAANGLGYGYALQLSGQAAADRKGFAMGFVTAFYAVGATLAPILFIALIRQGGNPMALGVMAVIIAVVALISAVLVHYSKAVYQGEPPAKKPAPLSAPMKQARVYLWVSYGSAVAAGLMLIGHAYGIASWLSNDSGIASSAPVLVALGNMLGGFSAGSLADRLSSNRLLRWLPLFSCVGLLVLVSPFNTVSTAILAGLAIVGYSYGALIAVYPVAISDIFTATAAPRIYGQIFTAWGVAGLIGPWFSGWQFDRTGSYQSAIVVAMVLSALSIIALTLQQRRVDRN